MQQSSIRGTTEATMVGTRDSRNGRQEDAKDDPIEVVFLHQPDDSLMKKPTGLCQKEGVCDSAQLMNMLFSATEVDNPAVSEDSPVNCQKRGRFLVWPVTTQCPLVTKANQRGTELSTSST